MKKQICLPLAIMSITACSYTGTNNWMGQNKDIFKQKNITNITLPGSQLANSYNIKISKNTLLCPGESMVENPTISSKLYNIWSSGKVNDDEFQDYINVQNQNIYSQLNSGVRYIELKICLLDNQFYTSDYFITDSLNTVFKQINKFISSNPNEIIIVDLDNQMFNKNGYLNESELATLNQQIVQTFKDLLIPNKGSIAQLNMSKLWSNRGRILVMSSNPILNKNSYIWDKNYLVGVNLHPTWSTIKKLTEIQEFTESTTHPVNKLSIVPLYSTFNPDINNLEEVNNNIGHSLITDYVFTLPESAPLNIVVGNKFYIDDITRYTLLKYNINH